jgi:hypothetical protein
LGSVTPAEPTVYVSGDNASLDVVRAVAARFPDIAVALLFGGAARTALLGDANLTLDAAGLVAAARILGEPEFMRSASTGGGILPRVTARCARRSRLPAAGPAAVKTGKKAAVKTGGR